MGRTRSWDLGVDDLRWMQPVRPGDLLHARGEVVETDPIRTNPQGIAKIKWTGPDNQSGEAFTPSPICIVRVGPTTSGRFGKNLEMSSGSSRFLIFAVASSGLHR